MIRSHHVLGSALNALPLSYSGFLNGADWICSDSMVLQLNLPHESVKSHTVATRKSQITS